jgi:hypothetical protein
MYINASSQLVLKHNTLRIIFIWIGNIQLTHNIINEQIQLFPIFYTRASSPASVSLHTHDQRRPPPWLPLLSTSTRSLARAPNCPLPLIIAVNHKEHMVVGERDSRMLTCSVKVARDPALADFPQSRILGQSTKPFWSYHGTARMQVNRGSPLDGRRRCGMGKPSSAVSV